MTSNELIRYLAVHAPIWAIGFYIGYKIFTRKKGEKQCNAKSANKQQESQ